MIQQVNNKYQPGWRKWYWLDANPALPLTDFITVFAALIIYGSQLIILKRRNWTWYSFNRIPGVEKGKTMLSNKIESWLSRRPFFFSTKTCCLWQYLPYHRNSSKCGDITQDYHGDAGTLPNNRFCHHCLRLWRLTGLPYKKSAVPK